MQAIVAPFVAVLFVVTSVGYLLVPHALLSIVGIEADQVHNFLARALAVALIALVRATWAVRSRRGTDLERSILLGIAGYLFLSAEVDLHAYSSDIVGPLALPSIAIRMLLGFRFPLAHASRIVKLDRQLSIVRYDPEPAG